MLGLRAPGRTIGFSLVLLALIALAGCAGGSSNNSPTPGGNNNPGGMTNPGGQVVAPTVVSVGAGETVSGANIVVPAPANNPAPNAIVLGVTFTSRGSATNTGAQIARGSSGTVLIFGPGINGNKQIIISGPGDITVSNKQTIKATDGTPGIAFDIAVPSSAAVGARSVMLQSLKNDITSFTGGLEVTP